MTKPYEPEIGQLIFGQESQKSEVSGFTLAILEAISGKLMVAHQTVFRLNDSRRDTDPFSNSGHKFSCEAFDVEAYSWDDAYDQPYNFRWRDIKVSWYKYLGRGTSANMPITPDMAAEMLDDCSLALERWTWDRIPPDERYYDPPDGRTKDSPYIDPDKEGD